MLGDVGCTLEQLQRQAEADCFESEKAREAWLVVSSFEPVTA